MVVLLAAVVLNWQGLALCACHFHRDHRLATRPAGGDWSTSQREGDNDRNGGIHSCHKNADFIKVARRSAKSLKVDEWDPFIGVKGRVASVKK